MRLLVIRHALAKDKTSWARTGKSDDERPLTFRGRRRMRRGARGLGHLVETPTLIASSPLVRARQTAEIVSDAFGGLPIEEVPALAPHAAPVEIAAWIRRCTVPGEIALVGHEPGLGELVSWCLAGRGDFLVLGKGGACLLELEKPDAGTGRLLWSLSPAQLRCFA